MMRDQKICDCAEFERWSKKNLAKEKKILARYTGISFDKKVWMECGFDFGASEIGDDATIQGSI